MYVLTVPLSLWSLTWLLAFAVTQLVHGTLHHRMLRVGNHLFLAHTRHPQCVSSLRTSRAPWSYISYFPHRYDALPDNHSLRKEVCTWPHTVRVQLIMVGEARWQKHAAAGHVTSAFGKQRVMTDDGQHILSFSFSPEPQFIEWCHGSWWVFYRS